MNLTDEQRHIVEAYIDSFLAVLPELSQEEVHSFLLSLAEYACGMGVLTGIKKLSTEVQKEAHARSN